MINENMKSIHTDSTGAVTVTEVGKKYNRMMSLRRPKYGCMADLSSLPTDSRGRIQWSKSIGKKIYVTYEEIYASFTVTGISRVAGCHDAYVTLSDGKGELKTVLASTIKDKNLGRLFNRYIKYHYRLNEGDCLKTGEVTDTSAHALRILAKTIKYDSDGIGHKAYVTECTGCGKHQVIEEHHLLCKRRLCDCHRPSKVFIKVA